MSSPLPISKTQLTKLGGRLAQREGVAEEDFDTLAEVLLVYAETLDAATPRIGDATGLPATSRVKNTETIREKLRRGSNLASIQDLAGARVVVPSRARQDAVVEALLHAFADESRAPTVKDRRADPSSGYRAVHVIVFPDDLPIEVQVRTVWQHRWAELFERFADAVGREVRYGHPPFASGSEVPSPTLRGMARYLAASFGELSATIARLEEEPAVAPDPRRFDQSWFAAARRRLLDGTFSLMETNLKLFQEGLAAERMRPRRPDEER